MNKPIIWFDCDGVLLDWTRPFLDYAGHDVKYEELNDIDLSKLYSNPDDFLVHMEGYHHCMRFESLSPLVEPEAIDWLASMTDCEINIITQLEGHTPQLSRIKNIVGVFGRDLAQKIHFTKRGECKLERILAQHPTSRHIIIEDHPATLKRISNRIESDLIDRGTTNITAYAVHHPYNTMALQPLKYIQHVPNTYEAIKLMVMNYGK